ncbi:MAG TPA: hypothetical protein VKA64_00820 [Gammaproteobacteria bacterium]|nr:hypothetical protein [Gammaproteobacteria bacterium]
MRNKSVILATVLGAAAWTGSAQAADVAPANEGWAAGARVSTLGLGVEVVKGFTPKWNARVGFNTYSYDDDRTENGIDYDAELDLQSVNAFLDFHPMENPFRLSIGYLFSSNELDMEANGDGSNVDIGNATVPLAASDQLNGDVDLGSGGYIGIGWGDTGLQKGWSVSAEAGVVFQGTPDVDLSASQSLRTKITNAGLDADAELQREEDELEDDLDEFDRYPVIAVGVTYGF